MEIVKEKKPLDEMDAYISGCLTISVITTVKSINSARLQVPPGVS